MVDNTYFFFFIAELIQKKNQHREVRCTNKQTILPNRK